MSHKIPEAEAVELMLAKNLKPLETYPGRAKPWKCKCLICENIVTPRLASIRPVVQHARQACEAIYGSNFPRSSQLISAER
ncbi:MAG: hypothetical protein F2927_04955 [Actinobacteria bacterium]|uniref:Unannotated protein n=1 Tax=freshwater metagenome TaxID=449393 RepID=A0A6J7NC61_9ZZZZ|nr:hypothetical protein [Actinomycetota bacterium]MSY10009.1 hypothetical protein [Actinomycetota bacterium]MTB16109.1 hypothetical protein [Actinomycetota bacterium]